MPLIPSSDTLVISSAPPSWKALTDITFASHKRFCDYWGYDYYADVSSLTDRYYDPVLKKTEMLPVKGFRKLDLILQFMDHYKQIVWVDADALVTNVEAAWVQDFVKQLFWTDILMPYDWNGHNATVIMTRTSELTRAFWWACNNTGRKFFLKHDWCEMEASRYFSQTSPYRDIIYYESIKKLCGILPSEYEPAVPRAIMAPYAWEPGDWVLHFSAVAIERRIELAKFYAEQEARA